MVLHEVIYGADSKAGEVFVEPPIAGILAGVAAVMLAGSPKGKTTMPATVTLLGPAVA